MTGPRSEPPMPTLITLRIFLPVCAEPLAAAHAVGEAGHLVEHGVDLGNDVLAVDHDRGAARRRRATCSTARRSVTLILSPRNMASIRSRRPDSSANWHEQVERFVGDAVLGIVEIDAHGLGRQTLAAAADRRQTACGGADRQPARNVFPGPSRPVVVARVSVGIALSPRVFSRVLSGVLLAGAIPGLASVADVPASRSRAGSPVRPACVRNPKCSARRSTAEAAGRTMRRARATAKPALAKNGRWKRAARLPRSAARGRRPDRPGGRRRRPIRRRGSRRGTIATRAAAAESLRCVRPSYSP